MPTFIAPIVQAVGTAITGSAIAAGTVAFISNAIALVGTVALSSWQKNKAADKARAAFESSQVDRLNNIMTAIGPREMVLGKSRKGGTVYFRAATGPFKNTFVMCVVVASHEIDAFEQIYFNNEPVDINSNGQVTTAPYSTSEKISYTQTFTGQSITLDFDPIGPNPVGVGGGVKVTTGIPPYTGYAEIPFTISGRTVTLTEPLKPAPWETQVSYQYQGLKTFAFVKLHRGEPGQQAEPELLSLFPGMWTPEHRASGVAYIYCRFAYDKTAFPSGLPKVTAKIRGAKIYDPRSGATVFTENPALMMQHVLMHPQFGKRTSLTLPEYARIIAAANACDQMVSYTGADWVPLFRGGIVYQFGAPARDILDDLVQAMGGMWAFAAGEFFVRAGTWQAPVMELTDDDLAVVQRDNSGGVSQEPITINVHKARNDKFNVVVPRIWDQNNAYALTAITPMKADALIAADGGELVQEATMPAVFYAMQALHIAGMMIRDARDPLTVTLPVKLRAYPLELFDSIWLTLARYGWATKEFVILGRSLGAGGRIQLTLKETAAGIFERGAAFPPQGYAPNTNLPRPWDIQPPQIVSIHSGESELTMGTDGSIVNNVRVTWLPLQDASVVQGGDIEVQWRVLPNGPWRSETVPGGATEAKFSGVDDLVMVLIRARSHNTLATSDWSLEVLHKVIGKTEPPPDIEDLNIAGSVLTWRLPRRVPDLAGYIFRFHYGDSFDWGSAAPLHEGVITASPYELVRRPGGVVTIMGKALDTSGNESLATANIVMNLGDPPIANIVEQWDFAALGWPFAPGEQSGWMLIAGKPTADDLDSFYGTDDQSFYGQDNDPFYKASAYAQLVYVSPEVSLNAALAGSVMTILLESQGIDLKIDYRLSGPGSFYGPDASSFYGDDDAAPFYLPPGEWQPWPGQLVVSNDVYQFRVRLGAGAVQGVLEQLVVVVDAPDMEEEVPDLPIDAAGTVVPSTKPFTNIKTVQVTLQANGSGARTVQVDKSVNLAPVVRLLNAAGVAVSGATADITLKGY